MRDLSPTARHPRKTSRDDARRWNLLTALQTIAAHGTVSRADIARATGLTRASVSNLVAHLIDDDLVRETGTADIDGVGKPATLLAINGPGRQIVAVDLSRQPFRAALVDLVGERQFETTAGTTATGDAAIEQAAELVRTCLDRATAPVLGVGVATPGMLDADGTVRISAHLEWNDVPLQRILSDQFDHPVVVGNDAHLAALAEVRGRPDESETLLLVKVGEGIGAGLVLKGELHTGEHLSSGEIGHVVVTPDGIGCSCGATGCLETIAAVPAVTAAATETSLTEAAAAAGRHLGAVLAVVVSAIDVNEIVVASELTAVDGYVDGVRSSLVERMHVHRRPDVVVSATVGADHGIAGAAAAVMRRMLGVVLR